MTLDLILSKIFGIFLFFGSIFIAVMIAIILPIIILLKISFTFYKNKQISLSLYILYISLGFLAGYGWASVFVAMFTPGDYHPLVLILCLSPLGIGSLLGVMVKLPKTIFTKILFGLLIVIFITLPMTALFFSKL